MGLVFQRAYFIPTWLYCQSKPCPKLKHTVRATGCTFHTNPNAFSAETYLGLCKISENESLIFSCNVVGTRDMPLQQKWAISLCRNKTIDQSIAVCYLIYGWTFWMFVVWKSHMRLDQGNTTILHTVEELISKKMEQDCGGLKIEMEIITSS